MSIKKGTTSISKVYKGNTEVSKIYKGTTLVYENEFKGGLTFFSSNPFIMAEYNSATAGFVKGWDGTMQYSTNKTTWYTWDGSGYLTAVKAADNNYYIYIRGTNNTYVNTASDYRSCMWVFYKPDFSGQISDVHVRGNIETLLDYQTVLAGNHPTMGNYAFACLFQYQLLVEVPILPATTLTKD